MIFAVISTDKDEQQLFVDHISIDDDADNPKADAQEVTYRLRPYCQMAEAFDASDLRYMATLLENADKQSVLNNINARLQELLTD